MDAEQARIQIRAEVQNALVDSQNVMMTEMRTLIDRRDAETAE